MKKGALISLFKGAFKGAATHGIGKLTRDGSEGPFTKIWQDYSGGRVVDKAVDKIVDELDNLTKKHRQNDD